MTRTVQRAGLPLFERTLLSAPVVADQQLTSTGATFALNLISDGYRVLAYDRDPARVAELQRQDRRAQVSGAQSGRWSRRRSPSKDLRLTLAEAEREAVPLPEASLVHDRPVDPRFGARMALMLLRS